HLALGSCDEGLIALYDVQRLGDDNPGLGLAGEIEALRRDLEASLVARTTRAGAGTTPPFSHPYSPARSGYAVAPGIERTLESLAVRLGASAAFVALRPPSAAAPHVQALYAMEPEAAADLARYLFATEGCRPRVLAPVDGDFSLRFPALTSRAG